MKKLISLTLAIALIVVLAVPVSAADDSSWIELLESTSINDNGSNQFSIAGSGTLTIPLHKSMRLRKIDLLVSNPNGQRFTEATVTSGGSSTYLNIYALGGNLTRIVGFVPHVFYESIQINLKKGTTSVQWYEVLSCKVTAIGVHEFVANSDVYWNGSYYPTEMDIVLTHDVGNGDFDHPYNVGYTARVNVYDWQKYDTLSIWGSVNGASISSIRATVGTSSLPMTVSYMSGESDSTWLDWATLTSSSFTEGTGLATDLYGKSLYCVTLDLSGVDRTSTAPMYIYFTGVFDGYNAATFTCMYVNGSVTVADTSEQTAWTRFKGFMTDLFGVGDGQEAIDDLSQSSASISQGASDIHSFEQSQQDVLNTGFAAVQSAVTFTNFAAALVFVQKYANMTINGISKYTIVFTLPLFLGLFFYLCSRVPGVTRWKTRPPKSKGGESP